MGHKALIVELEAAEADALGDALLELGALAVSADDPAAGTPDEVPLFGEPRTPGEMSDADWDDDQRHTWPRLRLRALLEESADADAMLAAACASAGIAAPEAHGVETVPEQDWVRLTQAQFAPIQVGRRMWIVPSWHDAPDADAINIALDPGAAFGTGSHPTTRLCLAWLEQRLRKGDTVLDYGCGSGILAIAAMKLGAASASGVDIDPVAVLAARDNAARNGVDIEFAAADQPGSAPSSVVVANILANPLRVLAPLLAGRTAPGGRIALAGLLTLQSDELVAIYSRWFDMAVFAHEEGWTCLEGVRKAGGD